MKRFFVNKYPIRYYEKGKEAVLDAGNAFIIDSINGDFFVLKPATNIPMENPIMVGPFMLQNGFTEQEFIK